LTEFKKIKIVISGKNSIQTEHINIKFTMLFSELPITKKLKENLIKLNFDEMTSIQQRSIPDIINGVDLLGLAQTGTGKTFAYLLPILNSIFENKEYIKPHSLILAPTRELVSQIVGEAKKLSVNMDVNVVEIIGGKEYEKQIQKLKKGADIIVATPGRLIDYIKQDIIKLNHLSCLVLDEADRMLDMGFANDIRTIILRTPKSRQTLMFSATMPYEIHMLASQHMVNPLEVNVSQDNITIDKIDQKLYHLGREEKLPYLINTILKLEDYLILVFTNLRVNVDSIVYKLLEYGIPAKGISSLLPQKKRTKLMSDFKSGKIRVLVATDVASRGIDVEGISHVFNYDLPQDPENYVHRIGRTARAGESGIAISFCSEYDYEDLTKIEKILKAKIENINIDPAFCRYPVGNFNSLLSKDDIRKLKRPRDKFGKPRRGRKNELARPRSNRHSKPRKVGRSERIKDYKKPEKKEQKRKYCRLEKPVKPVKNVDFVPQKENMERIQHVGPNIKKGFWTRLKTFFKK
jgi:ATP-dependent RNA helicase RhlB